MAIRGLSWGLVAAALPALLVATACSGAANDAEGPGNGAGDDSVLAALGIIDPGVDVADQPGDVESAEFRTGQDGEALAVADLVRTDAAGFADVRWTEGALARIDVDTLLEVTELDLETGQPTISTRLEVGRVWNRLNIDTAEYTVATDVGTAAVRGTGFVVACGGTCTFGVAEGVVVVTTTLGIEVDVRAGEQVTVDEEGQPGDIEPFVADEWVSRNLGLDQDAGFAPIGDGGDDGRTDIANGRMEGPYDFSFTMESSSVAELEGQQVDRAWTWFPACDSGPCGGEWDPGDGGREPFAWTGQGYTASWVDRPAGECPDGSSRWAEDFVLVITPTAVDTVGDTVLVTELTATWESTLTPLQSAIDSGCDPGEGSVDQFLTGTARPSGFSAGGA